MARGSTASGDHTPGWARTVKTSMLQAPSGWLLLGQQHRPMRANSLPDQGQILLLRAIITNAWILIKRDLVHWLLYANCQDIWIIRTIRNIPRTFLEHASYWKEVFLMHTLDWKSVSHPSHMFCNKADDTAYIQLEQSWACVCPRIITDMLHGKRLNIIFSTMIFLV